MRQNNKVALVTGASSGIGQATAELLSTLEYQVFGTSRADSKGKVNGKFEMLALDVTDDDSVEAFVTEVIRRAGRIDLLVNNAGFGIVGGAEESSLEQVRAIFDTNVFGCIRMIKAVLPIMRNQREGRIINISSIFGKVPAPHMGLYAGTKHAMEGYSESLDHEIRKFNVRSILIEPAHTKTKFDQSSQLADGRLEIYDKGRSGLVDFLKNDTKADSVEDVAKTIIKAATDRKPKVRYAVKGTASQFVALRRFVPESFFDSAIRKGFHLDE